MTLKNLRDAISRSNDLPDDAPVVFADNPSDIDGGLGWDNTEIAGVFIQRKTLMLVSHEVLEKLNTSLSETSSAPGMQTDITTDKEAGLVQIQLKKKKE